MTKPIPPHAVSLALQAAALMKTPTYLQQAVRVHEQWMTQASTEEAQLTSRLTQLRKFKREFTTELLKLKKVARTQA
jgi:hypothetical protein